MKVIACFFSNVTANGTVAKCCSGLCIDLLQTLSKRLGFEFELIEVPDKAWGGIDPVGGTKC